MLADDEAVGAVTEVGALAGGAASEASVTGCGDSPPAGGTVSEGAAGPAPSTFPLLVSASADESVGESEGVAHAAPGDVAIAVPMPRATASAPTRPICLACTMRIPSTALLTYVDACGGTQLRRWVNPKYGE